MNRVELTAVVLAGLANKFTAPLHSHVRERLVKEALAIVDELLKQSEK